MRISIVVALCAGCVGPVGEPGLAGEIAEAPGATGEGFGDPERAINGVRGGGERMQSLDVYEVPLDSYLVLAFDRALRDGPGDDLALFENAFVYGEDNTFIDPAILEVSADGETWEALAHDYLANDETMYSARREDWRGFGGVTPVYLHAETNPVDPFSEEAGGDRFDLAGREGIRFVRIIPAQARTNPDTDLPFPQDPVGDGPDVDGLYARYFEEER